jgi:HAD superfamily phosphatase
VVEAFSARYFGGDPDGEPTHWQGFIRDEPLLVDAAFFRELGRAGMAWGFVSGAEPPSCRYVLCERLGLVDPPLIAMGDAPDKPDPTGLLRLAQQLGSGPAPEGPIPVAYLGDTVADVHTVLEARRQRPDLRLLSLAVAPPHLHTPEQTRARARYERALEAAGADRVIPCTRALDPEFLLGWLAEARLSAPSPPAP